MSNIWDSPELQSAENYFRFDNPGDSIEGEIITIRAQKF